MKTTKISLANIQGKLGRTEMKKIIGGGSGATGCTLSACYSDQDCHGTQKCKSVDCVYDNGTKGSYNMCWMT